MTFDEYRRLFASRPPSLPEHRPWEGPLERKPWDYRVTAAIPVNGSPDIAELCVWLLLAQTERVYVMLIDTASDEPPYRCDHDHIAYLWPKQVEVHSIRCHGWRHPSDPPAAAMDLAFALCRTPYLFATHSDCFLRCRNLIADMVDLCRDQSPVVGYRLSPRQHPDWQRMFGHTCTMFDMAAMDRIGACWSLRRLCRSQGLDWRPNVCGPGWPDTELLINYQCLRAGITPHFIGTEENRQRTLDANIDHFRSFTSSRMYDSEHHAIACGWKEDAMLQARARLALWAAEDAAA